MKKLIITVLAFLIIPTVPKLVSALNVTFNGTEVPGGQIFEPTPFGNFMINSLTVLAIPLESVDLLILTNASITRTANVTTGPLQAVINFSENFDSLRESSRPAGNYPSGVAVFGSFNPNPGNIQYTGIFAKDVILDTPRPHGPPSFDAPQALDFAGIVIEADIPCGNGDEEFSFCSGFQQGTVMLDFFNAGDTVEMFGSIRQAVSLIPCIGLDCSAGVAAVQAALPLPSSLLLFASGLAGFALFWRKQRLF